MQQCLKSRQVSKKVNLYPLDPAAALLQLGCTITYNNSDWAALYQNLGKSRRRWGVVWRVLDKTGTSVQARTIIYKTIVQTVLLYSSKS